MKRIHNTHVRVLNLKTKVYPTAKFHKPIGLWYGFEDSWIDWCMTNTPDFIERFNHILEVDTSKILTIKYIKELKDFFDEYKYFPREEQFKIGDKKYDRSELRMFGGINWKEVSKKYSGIEIINYKEMRKVSDRILPFEHSGWFWGLDCDSGCIWDLSAVQTYKIDKQTFIY